jgi:tetratricopeptide (TPR) repeat protein
VALGALAVPLLLLAARRIGQDAAQRWRALGLLLGTGATQFAFGYIEAYPLVWLLVLAYLVCGLEVTRPPESHRRAELAAIGAAASSGLAAAAHVSGFCLVPGLLVLALSGPVGTRIRLGMAAAWLLPVAGAYAVLPRLLPDSTFGAAQAIPLVGDVTRAVAGGIAGFRWDAWLLRQLNLWGLVAPIAVAALLPLVLAPTLIGPDCRRTAWLTTSALPFAAAMLVVNSDAFRGAAPDWDVFAAGAPLFAALGGVVWCPVAAQSAAVRRALTVVVAVSLFTGLSFVVLQAKGSASLRRFQDVVEHSPHASTRARGLGQETLAVYFRDVGDFDRSADHYGRALDITPGSPRLLRARGGVLSWARRHDEAADHFGRAARAEPNRTEGWLLLGLELARAGQIDSAATVLRLVVRQNPHSVRAMNELAAILSRSDSTRTEAYLWVKRSLRSDPDQPMAGELRRVLEESRRGSPR